MVTYCIVETDDGLTIVEQLAGMTAEDAAEHVGGILIDAGPYHSYDDAFDTLAELDEEEEHDRDELPRGLA